MRDCPTCGHSTPEGAYCVRCGNPLDQAPDRARRRDAYAAAPAESRWAPRLVSSLFPRLPHASEREFRIALAVGIAAVAALTLSRLFGVALVTAALLLPLLTLLYLYDVDVYERSPGWPVLWTVGAGTAAGVAVGLLADALAPSGPALIDRGSSDQMLVGGVVIPAVGTLAMLAGPLVLLPYRRFNDTLDGASFGAISAAAFGAAQAIVVGAGTLAGGLRTHEATLPWVERLLAMAAAGPVLAMGAIAFASAALWLRYRAPAGDRAALGALGHPAAALPLALGLIVAGAVTETVLASGLWLLVLTVLALAALLLLRQALHVGLLEEASERPLGPEIRCANCGASTVSHTFCGRCGIALAALPHDPAAGRRGTSSGRLAAPAGRAPRRVIVGAGLIGAAAAGGLAVSALTAPGAPVAPCRPGLPCATPPVARETVAAAFAGYTAWRSPALGIVLRFASDRWSIAGQGPSSLRLQGPPGPSSLTVTGGAAGADPGRLVAAAASGLGGQLLGLSADTSAADQILGPNVGLVPGAGAVFRATTATPQGPGEPVAVAILSARIAGRAVVVTVITPAADASTSADVLARADDTINSITETR